MVDEKTIKISESTYWEIKQQALNERTSIKSLVDKIFRRYKESLTEKPIDNK